MPTTASNIEELTTRQRILREASLLFAKKGYHGTSTREIANAVGIQQPSLFHHFNSKDAIMAELIAFDLDEPVAVAEREAAATGSPAVRFYRYLLWDIAFLCRSPYNLSSIESVRADPTFTSADRRFRRLATARETMIRDAITTREFVEIDPTFAQQAILWMIQGTLSEVSGETPDRANDIADQLASFAMRALLADPTQLDDIRAIATNRGPE
jgi:AcrR family transcriptional regulator